MNYDIPLYIESRVEKRAFIPGLKSKHLMEGKPELWPQQLLSALLVDHPYLSNREWDVQFRRVDPDLGYALGYFTLMGEDRLKIPFVVRDRYLLPTAMFLYRATSYPLTEARFESVEIANAAQGWVSADEEGFSEAFREQMWVPPQHTTFGGNRGILNKLSSAPSEVLGELSEHLNSVEFGKVAQYLSSVNLNSEKIQSKTNMPSDAILLEKVGLHRYRVCGVSETDLFPKDVYLTRSKLQQVYGEKVAAEVSRDGYRILSDVRPKLAEDLPRASEVNRPGLWCVRKVTGEPLQGLAITKVVDFSGCALPLKIFFNGSESAVQDDIVGEFLGGADIPEGEVKPKGECVFLYRDDDGLLCSTIPFSVISSSSGHSDDSWLVETYLGEQVVLHRTGALRLVELGPSEYSIPLHYRVVMMADPENRVELLSTVNDYDAVSKLGCSVVELRDTGGGFRIKGAGINLVDLSNREAKLYLTAIGAPEPARLLKKASALGPFCLYGEIKEDRTRELSDTREKLASHAAVVMSNLRPPLLPLLKFAAAVLERPFIEKAGEIKPRTVDDVLSLGFINEDNTQTFLSHLSSLEETAHRLASLVLASQMGYAEIPEEEVISAMYSVERVLAGLRKLKLSLAPTV